MILTHTATRTAKLLSLMRGEMGLSHNLIKRLKPRNAFRVNGNPAHTDHRVAPGDIITVTLEESPTDIDAEDLPLSILHEDDAIILIDKPAGMLMHPSFHRIHGTLANALLGHYQRSGHPCAVHLVTRLDRDTFGVVLAAKNAHTKALLCDALLQGRLHKTYHALTYGIPEALHGDIKHPIARLAPQSLLRCVREDGKAAHTTYRVLSHTDDTAHLSLSPITGRTHQLRVHCAHEGFPILGDAQYGTGASQAFSAAHGIHAQQLCAVQLSFPHPLTGETLCIRTRQHLAQIELDRP